MSLAECPSASSSDDLAERSAMRQRSKKEESRRGFPGSLPECEMLNFQIVLYFSGEEQPREKPKKAQAVSSIEQLQHLKLK